jgi:hypothetical protein
MSDKGKALAGRPAEYAIDDTIADTGRKTNFGARQTNNGTRNNSGVREIEFMNGTMDGVDLDRCHYVEARLLKSEAHAAGPGE